MDNKTKNLPYIIAVDFDGTLCENAFPEIGEPKVGMIKAIKDYQAQGFRIILWTCRNYEALDKAVEWCEKHGLKFDAVNTNIPEVQEMFHGDTRKVYADVYIDDKNVLLKEVDRSGIRSIHTGEHS
jgi:hydroxymethylpyrimidine pyrophosphatase-like HAD family hydrolase